MNTPAPSTPLDIILTALRSVSNFPADLESSVEKWMANLQQNLAIFSDQLEKATAEYEKTEAEAFGVLKRGGWLGMERHLTGPQVRIVLSIARRNGENAAFEAIGAYFREDNWALVKKMIEQWMEIPYFQTREQIVREAFEAHCSGKFTLTVPTLLPLAEGLSAEIVGAGASNQNVAKQVAREWRAREQEVWTELYSDVVIHVIYKHYDFTRDPAPYLNRNGILHGRVPDYGIELNSLRVFLLVDCVTNLWLEDRRRKTP